MGCGKSADQRPSNPSAKTTGIGGNDSKNASKKKAKEIDEGEADKENVPSSERGSKASERSSRSSKSSRTSEKEIPKKDIKEGGFGISSFIVDNRGKVQEFYKLEKKKIGEGTYGSVCRATDRSTGAARAVKAIPKDSKKNIENFQQEIAIMKMLDHPNIIKLYESFEDRKYFYLVMELCTGGELFDRIINAGHFQEVQAAILMQQIVRAIFYMHGYHICHRDLKPENFIFLTEDSIEESTLKIIDFGLSCAFSLDENLSTKAGSPYYVAPQVLEGKYDQSCDLWSCGVIMYVLLCGYPPFYGDTDAQVLAKVRSGDFAFKDGDWQHISEDAKELIRMLLKMDPKERFTAEQTLKHEWIKNKAPKASKEQIGSKLVDNLRSFRTQNKLKKAALHIIASQLSEDVIKQLRDIFMALDDNNDGKLTLEEVKQGIDQAGLKEIPADLQQILDDVDSDGSGVIDYTEFLAASLDRKTYMKEDICWSAFRVFDRNGDGRISADELKAMLSGDDSFGDFNGGVAEIMCQLDTNGDGLIDFHEFMAMMRKPIGADVVVERAELMV